MEIVVKALGISLADFFVVDSNVFYSLSPDSLFHFFNFPFAIIFFKIERKEIRYFFMERLYAIKMDELCRLIRHR